MINAGGGGHKVRGGETPDEVGEGYGSGTAVLPGGAIPADGGCFRRNPAPYAARSSLAKPTIG